MNSRLRLTGSQARWFIALIGPAIFLAIIVQIDLSELAAQVYAVDVWTVLYSGILAVVVILVKGVRWYALAVVYGVSIRARPAIVINYEGAFWGGITPGKLGEFIKAKRMKDATGIDLFDGVMLCSLDKLFDFLAVGVITVISGSIVAPEVLGEIGAAGIGRIFDHSTIMLVVSIGVIVVILVSVLRVRTRLTQIIKTLGQYSGVSGIYIFFISIVSLFVYVYAVYVIVSPVLPAVSLSQVTFFVMLTMMAGALPVSIGNIGTRDVVAIGVLGMWGVEVEGAIAVSLMMMFLYLVATLGSWAIYRANPVE